MPLQMRLALLAGGIALIGTGAVAVFVAAAEVGAASLLASGLVLAVVGVLGDRLHSLKYRDLEIQLREAQVFAQAAAIAEEAGDTESAGRFRREAMDRLADLRDAGDRYSRVRADMPSGPQRTYMLEKLLAEAREQAASAPVNRRVVHDLFASDNDGDRIAALGAMQVDPNVRNIDLIVDAIENSRSAFEQYQALALAYAMATTLDVTARATLRTAILKQRRPDGHIRPDTDRWDVSEAVLAVLESSDFNEFNPWGHAEGSS